MFEVFKVMICSLYTLDHKLSMYTILEIMCLLLRCYTIAYRYRIPNIVTNLYILVFLLCTYTIISLFMKLDI